MKPANARPVRVAAEEAGVADTGVAAVAVEAAVAMAAEAVAVATAGVAAEAMAAAEAAAVATVVVATATKRLALGNKNLSPRRAAAYCTLGSGSFFM